MVKTKTKKWDMFSVKDDSDNKTLCEQIITTISENQLHQIQHPPTRKDAIVNLFCISNRSLVKSMHTIPGISYHIGIILADIALRAQVNKKPFRTMPSGRKRIGACWKRNWGPSWLTFFHPMEQETSIKTGKHLITTCKTSGSQFHPRTPAQDTTSPGYLQMSNACATRRVDCTEKPAARKTTGQNSTITRRPRELHSRKHTENMSTVSYWMTWTMETRSPSGVTSRQTSRTPIDDLIIKDDGVLKLLQGLNPSKASGPDEIPARLLKNLMTELTPAITEIYR